MAFVSQGAAVGFPGLLSPTAQRCRPGAMPGAEKREQRLRPQLQHRETAGKGGRSGLSLQDRSYHQQSPAPGGNGTGHCPRARDLGRQCGELGSCGGPDLSPTALGCCMPPHRGQGRWPGPASSASRRVTAFPPVPAGWTDSTRASAAAAEGTSPPRASPARQTPTAEPGGRQRSREHQGVPTVVSHRQQK